MYYCITMFNMCTAEFLVVVFLVSCLCCSSSPQHVEECCGWLRDKLNELNEEQHHIVHKHQEQVSWWHLCEWWHCSTVWAAMCDGTNPSNVLCGVCIILEWSGELETLGPEPHPVHQSVFSFLFFPQGCQLHCGKCSVWASGSPRPQTRSCYQEKPYGYQVTHLKIFVFGDRKGGREPCFTSFYFLIPKIWDTSWGKITSVSRYFGLLVVEQDKKFL